MLEAKMTGVANATLLDTVEKYVMAATYVFFAYRMISGYLNTGSYVTLIYLVDQLVVLAFILMRRPPKELSLRVDDWIFGFASTFGALLLAAPSGEPLASMTVVTAFLLVGFMIHVGAKLALRRSFGVVASNRGVKVAGVYRIVRHPMYLGYVVSQIGILLAGPSLTNVLIIAMCWTLFIKRIIAEERLLLRDAAYQDYAAQTRYRVIPGLY